MGGAAPKSSSRKGRAETPAPLSGATDAPEEKKVEAPADTVSAPAAAPVDQSTAPVGLQPPQRPTNTREAVVEDGAALAAADLAAAPADLPSGASAGVDPFNTESAPAGEASADPAGASGGEPARAILASVVEQLGGTVGGFAVNIGPAEPRLDPSVNAMGAFLMGLDRAASPDRTSYQFDPRLTDEQAGLFAQLLHAARATGRELSVGAAGFAASCLSGVDYSVRLRVFPGDNLRRAGRQFAVGEVQTFAPTNLTPEHLLQLLNERRFNLEWIETE